MQNKEALIGVIMGSDSDWKTLEAATEICDDFSVPYEAHVVSAHRTPDDMFEYAKNAHKKGLKVIIADCILKSLLCLIIFFMTY